MIENPAIAVILPARDEEAALGPVLAELLPHAVRHGAVVAVGLNDCRDRSCAVAEAHGVIVGETKTRGYGHGCLAAIAAIRAAGLEPDAYIFMAADGAHDPAELPRLIEPWRAGARIVLGQRTGLAANWPRLGHARAAFNVLLGAWAGVLSGRFYRDLGPFRLMDRKVFERIGARETEWGWTIEPQVIAPRLGVRVVEVNVTERPRIAGEQKVTGVSLAHTLHIGLEIMRAAWRSRMCELPRPAPELAGPEHRTAV